MEAKTLIYADPLNRALIHINYHFSEEAPLFVLTSTAEKGMCFINKLIYLGLNALMNRPATITVLPITRILGQRCAHDMPKFSTLCRKMYQSN